MGNDKQFPWAIAALLLVVFGAFQRVSGFCDMTPCGQLPANADACERHFNQYAEEIFRESCSSWGGSGEMAYCCEKHSTESLLSTTYGAELNEFPHMARLTLIKDGGEYVCGGTIYNRRYILTAAHCVINQGRPMEARGITVKVGRNIGKIPMPNNDYKVEEFFVHGKYSKLLKNGGPDGLLHHDIAVLRLDRDIVFGDNVKSLEIAPKGFIEDKYAENAVIVGWGTTHTFDISDHLQKVNVAIRKDETCFQEGRGYHHRWLDYGKFAPQLLCVGGHVGDTLDPIAAGGDSGGPAICRGPEGYAVLCGITSLGASAQNCFNMGATHCAPSVYAEVDYFRDWIQDHAKEQDPSTFHRVKLYGEPASNRAAHQVHITSDGGKPCGATLIAPDTVVTAAQCVAPGQGYTKAYTGIKVTSIKTGGKTYLVKSLNVLPGFERMAAKLGPAAREKRMIDSYQPHALERKTLSTDRYFKNDLAVLKLKERMDVDPRALPELANAEPSRPAYELSLPRNATKGSGLVQREFNILGRDECVRRMKRMEKVGLRLHVDENVLCGVEKYSGGSTCDRELGGGLICTGRNGKETLCGVQIARFCQWSIPNGFLDVRKESDWIKKAQNSQLNGAIIPEYPMGGNKMAPKPENYELHPQIGSWYRQPSGFKPSTGSRLPDKFGHTW